MLKVACSGPGVSRTRNLSVTSPILYHYTTAPALGFNISVSLYHASRFIFSSFFSLFLFLLAPCGVLKMSTVSPDTSRETAAPLTGGCNNNGMVPAAFCVRLTVSVSVLQDVIIIKRLRQGYYTGFVGNATACSCVQFSGFDFVDTV